MDIDRDAARALVMSIVCGNQTRTEDLVDIAQRALGRARRLGAMAMRAAAATCCEQYALEKGDPILAQAATDCAYRVRDLEVAQ